MIEGARMVVIQLQTLVPGALEEVFDLARDLDFHTRSLAHTGEHIVSGKRGGHIELGEEVEWQARHFGMTWNLRSRITAFDRPYSFTDEQVKGPFATLVHRHTFRSEGKATLMIDDWTHTNPYGPLGLLVEPVLKQYVTRLLRTRNAALCKEVERNHGQI
jgi:ligand-binding SRPBCC domain-containing protein